MTRAATPLVTALVTLALVAGCAPPRAAEPTPWAPESCTRHDHCPAPLFCASGQCARRGGDAPLDPAAWRVGPLLRERGGRCAGDEHCGPWVCEAGHCVEPASVGVTLPPARAFAYWDGSCLAHDDCPSGWRCAAGWCADAERMAGDPDLERSANERACRSDSACDEGEDCVYPGRCVARAGAATMTFADVFDLTLFASEYLACSDDADCGPWWCEDGACAPPEALTPELPARSAFAWMDASCAAETDCGPWACVGVWCRPAARAP